jgi:hypothetical protein
MLFPSRAILQLSLIVIVWSAAPDICLAKTCEETLSQALGSKRVNATRSQIEQAELKFRPAQTNVPEELAYTVSETLPLLRRVDLLNPVRPKPRIYVDTYYGKNYVSSSADVQIMPADKRTLCLLLPGRAVFLSDGVTHHYALVDTIDYQQERVTLLDPWAAASFLLPGRNSIGVSARASVDSRGHPFLTLSFDEFLRVLRGSIEEFEPDALFAGLEVFYPELAHNEDYLFWKYSRTFATDSFQMSIFPVIEFTSRKDLQAMPKLQLLGNWSNDYIIGVLSGFSVPKPGYSSKVEDRPALRSAFIGRLDNYSKTLPWNLKWLLLQRTQDTDDTELRLAIVDAFLKYDPVDTDFQIARAETLLRLHRYKEADQQLESARTQWQADVSAAIAKTPASEAVKFLFAKDYSLQSLAVLHWRNVRIRLLRQIAESQQNAPPTVVDYSRAMQEFQNEYVIGSIMIDFFSEVLEVAYLAKAYPDEDAYIRSAVRLPNDPERTEHLGLELYRHFVSLQPISEIAEPTSAMLRASPLGAKLCDLSDIGQYVHGLNKDLQVGIATYCKKKPSKTIRPTESPPDIQNALVQAATKFGATTAKEHAYCGSFFAFSVDREH